MGVWILYDSEAERAVYYDSTSEQALGVVSFLGADAAEQAGSFLGYLRTQHHRAALGEPLGIRYIEDPRSYRGDVLEAAHNRWRTVVGMGDEGKMNEYGWSLYEWQMMRADYGAAREPAPEPEEVIS
jgi:hypothetical protein